MKINLIDRLGIQSFCFREFTETPAVIAALKECQVNFIELCGLHIDISDRNAMSATIEEYQNADIQISAYGVHRFVPYYVKARQAFDCANMANFPTITTTLDPGSLPVVEALCRQTGKRAALHNHGRKHDLGSVEAIENLFANTNDSIGLCLDTAWMLDSGEDPVEIAHHFSNRLYGVHIKDFIFNRAGQPEDVIVGEGNLDLPRLAKVLYDTNFNGYLTLEYEGEASNPIPDLKKCIEAIKAAFS